MSKFITFYDLDTHCWTTLNTDEVSKICLGKEECILIDINENEYVLDICSYQRIVSELSTVTNGWITDIDWVKEQCKPKEVSGLKTIDVSKSSEEEE